MQTLEITVEVDVNGRILIPAAFRRENDWKKGTKLVLSKSKSGVSIVSKEEKRAKAQKMFQELTKNSKKSLVDSFLEFRKEERILEEKKLARL